MAITLNGTTGVTTTGLTSNGIDDNATSTAMTLDSSGNVGIGTASPADLVQTSISANTAKGIRVTNTNSGASTYASIYFGGATSETDSIIAGLGDSTTAYGGARSMVLGTNQATPVAIITNGTERMRIDSSGNLLVGTTVTDGGYDDADGGATVTFMGASIGGAASGTAFVSRRAAPLQLNRQANDGDIAVFRKNGTTVGSIGTSGNDLSIGTGDLVLKFYDAGPAFIPRKSNDANSDNYADLGNSNNRFKDLYLSGGVYLGGVGAANKLDDYEEGTWTPTLSGSSTAPSSVTYVARLGVYRKIGNVVYVSCTLVVSAYSGGSGEWTITGLPFNSAAGRSHFLTFNQNNQVTYPSGATIISPYVIPGVANVRARGFGSGTNAGLQLSAVPTSTTFETSFNGVYSAV